MTADTQDPSGVPAAHIVARTPSPRTDAGVKGLLWLQGSLLFLYFGGVLGLLLMAVSQRGGLVFPPFAEPSDPLTPMVAADPKEVLGLGILGIVIAAVLQLVALVGPLPALILAIAGVIKLPTVDRLRWWLVAGTALTIGCLVIQLTPFGRDVLTWMMD